MWIVEPSLQPCFRHRRAGGFMALVCTCCSLLAPLAELLLSTQVTSVTSWGTGPSPCAVQGVEGPDPNPGVPPGSWPHRVRSVGLSWVPEAIRWSGSFFSTLLQPQSSLSSICCCWGFSSILKYFLKIQIQLEHHLDGTGQRDSAASKKSPGKHSKS